jgi:hypothetical protein
MVAVNMFSKAILGGIGVITYSGGTQLILVLMLIALTSPLPVHASHFDTDLSNVQLFHVFQVVNDYIIDMSRSR